MFAALLAHFILLLFVDVLFFLSSFTHGWVKEERSFTHKGTQQRLGVIRDWRFWHERHRAQERS